MNHNRRKYESVIAACLTFGLLLKVGCSGGILGLEDYQRDLLFGGLATALLLNQPAAVVDGGAGNPVPGSAGEQGVPGVIGVDGAQGPAGPQGQQGEDGPAGATGPAGPAGSAGSSGGTGPQGPDGAAGPAVFNTFIDDFFAFSGANTGDLPVDVVSIVEPVLGELFLTRTISSPIAFRVSVPQTYTVGQPVTMRMFFHRTGEILEDCFIFSVTGIRLRDGEGVSNYGETTWLSIDNAGKVTPNRQVAELLLGTVGSGGELIVVDLPINAAPGLVDAIALDRADFLAFELATAKPDGSLYQILGVEFFASDNPASLSGASIVGPFTANERPTCDCSGTGVDCNNNGRPDDCDISDGTSFDCDGNGVLDECEDCNENGIPDGCDIDCDSTVCLSCSDRQATAGTPTCAEDCNQNGIPDSCDIADGTSEDCQNNDIPDECDEGCGIVDCNNNMIPDDVEIASRVMISTLDSSGMSLGTFPVGLKYDQFVSFIEVDKTGNIWVGRNDSGHGSFDTNPNDMVVKFSPTGTELLTLKGPMRDPKSVAFDSLGNIYVGGVPEGASLNDSTIFKYDSSGNFVTSFGLVTGPLIGAEYRAIVITSDDRIFANTGLPIQIYEYTTAGVLVRALHRSAVTSRSGGGLALSPDGTILWSYQRANGPGTDNIVEYNLSLVQQSSLGLNSIGVPILWGLDTLQNGSLVSRYLSKVFIITPPSTTAGEVDFSIIDGGDSFRRGFAVDTSGNYFVSHGGIDVEDCNGNGIPDECDIAADPSLDSNTNGLLDLCEDLD